ncbi:MAG: glycosyltransferase [candidate division KSB1 bacterium]|nr:glycosyltransferase [candidate division KSB1 bacterium]
MILCGLVLFALSLYALVLCRIATGLRALRPGTAREQPRVSVICAARNEANSIDEFVRCLVSQTYPSDRLQFVLIDDRSEDGTAQMLARWAQRDPRVLVVHVRELPTGVGPKKHALAKGIAHAEGELLLLTDADCRPPAGWVEGIVRYFEPDVGLVAGYAPLIGKGLLGAVVGMDTLASAAIAAAGIALGRPTTCTGRNLAYRRAVYDQVGGLVAIMNSPSGDDDLFLHLVARHTNWQMRYAICPSTFVPGAAPGSVAELVRQRRRHLSAGWHYPSPLKLGYALLHLANALLWLAPIGALLLGGPVVVPVATLAAKLVLDWFILRLAARRFGETFSWAAFCIWEPYFVLSNVVLGLCSRVGQIRWRQ